MPRQRTRNQHVKLHLLQNGDWQCEWREYITDPATGQVRQRHRTETLGDSKMSKAAAERERRKIEQRVNDSTVRRDARVTLSWFVENEFLPAQKGDASKPTLDGYRRDLKHYILPELAELPLENIDIGVLKGWLGGLGLHGRNYAKSVVRHAKILLCRILEYARERQYINVNPAKSRLYKMPKCKPSRKPVVRMFEIGQLFEAVTDVRDHLILLIARNSCTASETFGLIWEGIHEHEDFPYFEIQNSAFEGQFYEGQVKEESRRRNIAMDEEMRRYFALWRSQSKDTSPEALVFPSRTGGTMWSGIFLQKRIQPIARQLGIQIPITFQVLRRAFVTWNKHGRENQLDTVQAVVGHKRGSPVTEGVYDRPVPENQADMVRSYAEAIRAAVAEKKERDKLTWGQAASEVAEQTSAKPLMRRVQ
jgi:integrase